MKKIVRTSLNNVANKRGVRDLNIQLYSHDKNNAGFEFVIKNEVDLSEYKAKVLFDFQESFATWETKGTVEGNVVKVKFDTTFITKCEEVIGYLFLDSETDTLDVFKFKFNVVLSEIDKYDTAKRGFRYIKDQEVVDVITRSELEEEIKKLQVNGGIDLRNYLTTTVAEETYAKKSELSQRVATVYDNLQQLPDVLYLLYSGNDFNEYFEGEKSLFLNSSTQMKGKVFLSYMDYYRRDSPLVFTGDAEYPKTVEYDAVLYTAASSLPDGYSLKSLNEDNKVTFLSNKNFSEVVPKAELKAIIKEVLTELKSENN